MALLSLLPKVYKNREHTQILQPCMPFGKLQISSWFEGKEVLQEPKRWRRGWVRLKIEEALILAVAFMALISVTIALITLLYFAN